MDNKEIMDQLKDLIEDEKRKSEKYQQYNIKGWVCPVCGRGLSPYTSTCPCVQYTPPPTYPVYPNTSPYPVYPNPVYPTCNPKIGGYL